MGGLQLESWALLSGAWLDRDEQRHSSPYRIRKSRATEAEYGPAPSSLPGLQVAHSGTSVQVGLGINTCADQPTGSLSQLAFEDK